MTAETFIKKADQVIAPFDEPTFSLLKKLVEGLVEAHKLPNKERKAYIITNLEETKIELNNLSKTDTRLDVAVQDIFLAEINDLEWF